MNPEAVKWLEAQPFSFTAAITHYGRVEAHIQYELGEGDEDGSSVGVIQMKLFNFKDDHEGAMRNTGLCYQCCNAERDGTLIVLD